MIAKRRSFLLLQAAVVFYLTYFLLNPFPVQETPFLAQRSETNIRISPLRTVDSPPTSDTLSPTPFTLIQTQNTLSGQSQEVDEAEWL